VLKPLIRFLERFYPHVSGSPFWFEAPSFILNTLPVSLALICIFGFVKTKDYFWLFLSPTILIDFFVLGPAWKELSQHLRLNSPRPKDKARNGMPSAHMACATLFATNLILRTEGLWALIISTLLIVAIAWQRKYSRMHDNAQLGVGGLVGILVGLGVYWILSIYAPRPY
jgi:membrane-associated phospholipid phosphatase